MLYHVKFSFVFLNKYRLLIKVVGLLFYFFHFLLIRFSFVFPVNVDSSFVQNFEDVSAKFKCFYCSYSTSIHTNFQAHKRTHTGERPYKCSICLKSFRQKITLDRHQPSHFGERPYSCVYCKKSFTRKDSLKSHIFICNVQKHV